MDIAALQTVVLVAQHGSFAAAARVLNVDPSSVSRTVSGVENSLGLRLFQRSTRVLRMTEEGDVYLKSIIPLLEGLEQAHDTATALQQSPRGRLRMTASVAFCHECIVPALAAFRAKYPEVSVELLPTDATLDLAAQGIDLAIRLAPAPEGDLVASRLLHTRYRVCASPAYLDRHGPIAAPSDLTEHDCLRFALPGYRSRWQFRQKQADAFSVTIDGTLIIDNALAMRQAAVAGLGPALLADWLIAGDLAAGRLVDVFPDHDCTATTFETGAWALYPTRQYLPRKVRVMIDHLREHLRRSANNLYLA